MSSRKIRSILMIFLISVVSTSLLSLLLYNISTEIIKHQIEKQTESSLINLSNQVSHFQERISQAVIDLQNTEDYQQFIQSLPFENYESSAHFIFKFVNQLNAISASLDYVDNITFYNVENGQEYATNGVMNKEFNEFQEEIAKFQSLRAPQALLDSSHNGSRSVVYIQSLPLLQLKPLGYLIFHFNKHFLNRLLQNERGDSTYMIVNEDHQVLDSYSLDGKQDPAVQPPSMLWSPSALAEDQRVQSISDQGYFFILHKPVNQKWSYIYSIKESQALAPIIKLRNVVLQSTAALLLLSLLLYALSIHFSWRGWNRLTELIADSQGARSSDDFELLFQKIQGLTQNHNQLKDRMDVILPEAKDAFVKSLLDKGCSKRDYAKLKQYNIALGQSPYRCFGLEADEYKTLKERYSPADISQFEYGVACVIREVMNEANITGLVTVDHPARLVGIYETASKAEELALDLALTKIKSFINEYFPFTVSIGVSQTRSELAQLNVSYHESLESLKQKWIVGINQVIYYSDVVRKDALFSPDLYAIENQIVQHIRDKNRELAHGALSRLVDIKKAENIDSRSLQNYLVNMILFLFREFAEDHRFISQISVRDIVNLSTLEAWTEWIGTQCIDRLIDDLIQRERQQHEDAAAQLVRYIDTRLEEDLRLHEVCKQLGLPVNLATSALKDIYGMTFTEYLFQSRMELSKKWLRETSMSLDEISTRLFYSNAQNFSRAFKKIVGLPPGVYRKQPQGIEYVST
ncbi:helix-turn-helix domain-containing protein [Paenibacillus cremeus]|uniref:Helix-turn-helix transcriptional regulator n=1 Tax=Paenibacillus cremeus TaxID=2163881 RepID=A0A559KBE0_9BACL|nr:helix-turn-helix domain-containing protein [Paenibacillus cremeus]TVY09452.1 helix-turn-helix transcriptional regulator [Paenibacillus cremeus]